MSAVNAAFNTVENIQTAFEIIAAATYFAAHLWPKQANVSNCAFYDFIIVGGGSAGCVVASRLSEDPSIKVLLIEAGGNPPIIAVYPGIVLFEKTSNVEWNYTTEFDNYTEKCHINDVGNLALGKMLGGTSSLNFLYYQRGAPRDFDAWAKLLNDPSWKYENVLPLFKKSEKLQDEEIANSPDRKYHGFDGYIQVTKDKRDIDLYNFLGAFKELGNKIVLDLNGNRTLGYTKQMLIIGEDGTRSSSAYAFLSPAKDRPNLHVLKNALVTKIIFDKKKNAVAVKVNIGKRCLIIKAKREIILSAGPINTPQLLMLSGIGPKKHLKEKRIKVIKNLPVGQNLQDHVAAVVIMALDISKRPYCYQTPFNPGEYTSPITVGGVVLNKTSGKDYPDYTAISYFPNVVNQDDYVLLFCTYEYRYNNEVCQKLYDLSYGKQIFFSLIIDPYPKSRGYVKLRSKDPKIAPIIQPAYFYKQEDLDRSVEYVHHFMEILNTTYFRKMNAEFLDLTCSECKGKSGQEFWRCYVLCMMFGMSQLAGTCAMGSVVDSNLKVLGVQKLRVVDSSVMPTITLADTYIPSVMIAEKASIMIKDELKRCPRGPMSS